VSKFKKVVILQPNYIPWRGYFDLIASCDLFILYDDVQFTKNDWRNRNRIKTPNGLEWLSVPVGAKIDRLIRDVKVHDYRWQERHWKTLRANYSRARFAGEIFDLLEPVYLGEVFDSLLAVNRKLIETVCSYLQIDTEIRLSSEYPSRSSGSDGVLELCKILQADCYLSGPAARAYLREQDFRDSGIEVRWFDYSGYPDYPQLWGAFEGHVSVLDLLFNCGGSSRRYMKF
jgi:hypothetical protein